MKTERIKYVIEVDCRNAMPQLFSDSLIREHGMLSDKVDVDFSSYMVSPIVSNIELKGEFDDEINVKPHNFKFSSIDLDRVISYFEIIKNSQPKIKVRNIKFSWHDHFDDETFPHSVFSQFGSEKDFPLDVIKFGNAEFEITIYSCYKERIHIVGSKRKVLINESVATLDISEFIDFEESQEFYKKFVQEKIKIDYA